MKTEAEIRQLIDDLTDAIRLGKRQGARLELLEMLAHTREGLRYALGEQDPDLTATLDRIIDKVRSMKVLESL